MNRLLRASFSTLLVMTLPACATYDFDSAPKLDNSNAIKGYHLGVGDDIEIKFFFNPEFNETVMIRHDGMISLQLLDDVQAAGLTPMELDSVITERYGTELRRPEVTVIVKQSGKKVYVGGQVKQPGFVPYDRRMTALQAILQVGGFTNAAHLESVILIRRDRDGKGIVRKIDMERTMHTGESLVLSASDILFVPRSNIAEANKFVEEYIRNMVPIPVSLPLSVLF